MDEMDNKKIPADYNIPYFVHQDDLNKMDMSHKRVEKWLFVLLFVAFVALVGTNAYWIWYEQSYQDVVVTEATQDGSGVNLFNAGGSLNYGAEDQSSENTNQERW